MAIDWQFSSDYWGTRTLEALAPEVSNQVRPAEQPQELFNYWGLDAIEKDQFTEPTTNFISGAEISSTCVQFGPTHVLYSKLRPYLNKVIVPSVAGIGTTEWVVLEPKNDALDRTYLAHVLRTKKFVDYATANSTGARMPRARKDALRQADIPIPYPDDPTRSLAEQRRIVARIEALFAELRECQQTLGHLQAQTGRLMEAVLSETYDSLSQEHEVIEIAPVCTSITDGNHNTPQYVDSGVPFLFVSNVVNRYIDFRDTKFVTQEYYDGLTDTRKPEVGDILYTVVGSYGVPVEVDTTQAFCFQRHIGILKPDREKVYPSFLRWMLDAPQVLKQAHEVVTGSAQKTLTLTFLRKLRFPCPESLKIQKETALRIEAIYTEVNDMKQTQTADTRNFAEMEQAILNQAFRGEL